MVHVPTTRALSLALLAAALLGGGAPADAAPAPADLDLVAIVTVVPAGDAGADTVTLVVDRGAAHGVKVGAGADLYDLDDEGHPNRVIARAKVSAVRPRDATVVTTGPATGAATGWVVALRARVPPRTHRGALLAVAALHIALLDNQRQPLVTLDALLAARDGRVEQAALDAMVLAGREVVEMAEAYTDPLRRGGRFAGRTLADALAASTVDDYRRLLGYVRSHPGKYIGRDWKISEVYATWLINAEPEAAADRLEALQAARDDAFTSAARAPTDETFAELVAHIRAEVERWPAKRDRDAAARVDLVERAGKARDALPDAVVAELEALRATLLQRADATRVEAAAAWQRAAERWRAAGALNEALMARNNAGNQRFLAGRLDEAAADAEAVMAQVREALPGASPDLARALRWRESFAAQLAARVAGRQDRDDDAKRLWTRYAEIAVALDDMEAEAEAAWQLGLLTGGSGAWAEARDHYARAAVLRGRLGRPDEGLALLWEARSRIRLGDVDAAAAPLARAIALFREHGPERYLADAILTDADRMYSTKDPAGAVPRFEEAARLYRKLSSPADEAFALQGVSVMHLTMGDARKALDAGRRALALWKRAGDADGIALGHFFVGNAYQDLQRPKDARAAFEAAEANATAPSMRANILTRIAELDVEAGAFEDAERRADAALAIGRETRAPQAQLEALAVKRDLHGLRARYAEAEAVTREQLAIARAHGIVAEEVKALRQTAWSLVTVGRLSEARQLIDEAMARFDALDDPEEQAWVLNTLARIHGHYGDLAAEEEALTRALALVEGRGLAQVAAGVRFNRALNRMERNDYEGALAEIVAAAAVAGDAVGVEFEVALLQAQAAALTHLERFGEAEPLMKRALAFARERVPARVRGILGSLGTLQAEAGRIADAEATYREAVALAQAQLGDAAYGALADLGVLLARHGRAADATPILAEAVARARKRGGSMPWEALYHLGRVRAEEGDDQAAITLLSEAVAEIERGDTLLRDETAKTRYYADKLDVYRTLVKLLLSQARVEDALKYVERARLAELSEIDRRGSGPADPAAALATELEVQEARLQAMLDEELASARADMAKAGRLDGLLADVKRRRAAFIEQLDRDDALYDRYALRPMQLEKLQQHLPEGALVIAPVLLDDRVVVFAVTRTVLTHFSHDVAPDALAARVRAFARDVDPRHASGVQGVAGLARLKKEAQALYDLLVRPAVEAVGAPDTLVVSPMGPLRYVPFAALHDGERWLVERMAVVSATSLDREKFAAETPRGEPGATVLALVDPDGTLDGARREVLEIQKVYASVDVFEGPDATVSALRLKVRVPGYDVVHLAAHGRLDTASPEQSHIVMAGGPLAYADIPSLSPRRTRLVVLSACQTAVHTGGTGVEIAGLAYQFQRSDVHSVVATLWEVDDVATTAFMARFYAGLHAGKTYVEALANAQRAMIADKALGLDHPAYWAPFFLMGSP